MTNIRSKIHQNTIILTDSETRGTLTIVVKDALDPFDDDHQSNPMVELANDLVEKLVHKELQLRLEGDSTMYIRKPILAMLGRQSYDRVEVTLFSNIIQGDFSVKSNPNQ